MPTIQPATPTYLQTWTVSLFLLYISLVTLPISLALVLPLEALARIRRYLNPRTAQVLQTPNGSSSLAKKGGASSKWLDGRPVDGRISVLVNGARMSKSLTVSRALSKLGVRIVLVEEEAWGDLCATRFSSSISAFHLVPQTSSPAGRQAYIKALARIAKEEGCSVFVPCSGAGSTVDDAKAAELMRKEIPGFKAIIQEAELCKTLHEKDLFIELIHSLDLLAPSSKTVSSIPAALSVIRSSPHPLILKCTAELDDLGRADLTTYPLKGDDDKLTKTRKRLEGLKIPICDRTPYALQEFIGGGTEWCTHASVVEGKLAAFVCCPSNDMLMTYHNYTNTAVGRQALDYTQTFLSRLQARTPSNPLNGSFSFDFILSQDQKLYIIECNPRVHTACTLLPPLSFAKALLDVIPASTLPITPLPSTLPRSWVSHDLIVRLLPRLIPKGLRATIHPWLDQTVDERQGQGESWWWRDPMFDWEDPVPFLVLGHGQVVLLLWNCLVKKRKRWTRINVSTARVFEC